MLEALESALPLGNRKNRLARLLGRRRRGHVLSVFCEPRQKEALRSVGGGWGYTDRRSLELRSVGH
jgi:hypothetical protein